MRASARSAVTIVVLCSLLVVGAMWGWSEVTAPFPGKADAPICEDRAVSKGEKVYPSQVVVSVYNAGTRLGLAGRTMQLLTDQGFKEGDSGNAPEKSDVPVVQVWTPEPRNPAVQLVVSRLGKAHKIIKKESPGAGVTIVVGDGFRQLVKGPRFVVAKRDTTICTPVID